MKKLDSGGCLAGCALTDVGRLVAPTTQSCSACFSRTGRRWSATGVAHVGDRVVFSMPTAATPNPPLQLVNIPDMRVDWDAPTATQTRRGEPLCCDTGGSRLCGAQRCPVQGLDRCLRSADPAKRLSLVENARGRSPNGRRTIPTTRQADVQQMVSMLDEAIADSEGGSRRRALQSEFRLPRVPSWPN